MQSALNMVDNSVEQETQLSQRDSATLRVVENLAVSQGHSRLFAEYGVCKFSLVFQCN